MGDKRGIFTEDLKIVAGCKDVSQKICVEEVECSIVAMEKRNRIKTVLVKKFIIETNKCYVICMLVIKEFKYNTYMINQKCVKEFNKVH